METTFRDMLEEKALPAMFVNGARKLQDFYRRLDKPTLDEFNKQAEKIAKKLEIKDLKGFLEHVEDRVFKYLK